ncbi:unnamed protein product [Anisakis simplex]|uniref:Uncharacterized protein n=1 Tax=Anisakis simplex TaxID=6269 RepID=A0A0M3JIS6_ANISI|nr:unnamed protein product [Anisakis simplex]
MGMKFVEYFINVMFLCQSACIEIAELPSVARYKARVSYLPISDEKLKRATRLRHIVARKLFGEDHFKYDEISNIGEEFKSGVKADDMSEAFRDADLLENRRVRINLIGQMWKTISLN